MDVRKLKYFVVIVDSNSLSKAAERLYVAQPSLSQQVLNLEKELGAQLLIRSPQGVSTTDAGKTLYRLARDILRRMDLIQQEVREGSGSETGTVAIGFPTTIASLLATPLFKLVREKYPGIKLQHERVYYRASSERPIGLGNPLPGRRKPWGIRAATF